MSCLDFPEVRISSLPAQSAIWCPDTMDSTRVRKLFILNIILIILTKKHSEFQECMKLCVNGGNYGREYQ